MLNSLIGPGGDGARLGPDQKSWKFALLPVANVPTDRPTNQAS